MILDSDDVMSGLSALDGGSIDEILMTVREDNSSDRSGELNVKAVKARGGKNHGRKTQEETRRRRTEHSAAATLLDRLDEMDAIGEIDGALDEEVAGQLQPGMTVRLRGALELHPLHQADTMLRSFISAAPKFGEQETARELRKVLPMWDAMIGTGNSARVLFDLATAPAQVPRVLVPAKRTSLQVPIAEAAGHCTIVGKVDRMLGPDEEVLALRVLQNASVSEMERSAVEDAAVEIVEGFTGIGVSCSAEDVVMRGPLIMLRPLCVWR